MGTPWTDRATVEVSDYFERGPALSFVGLTRPVMSAK
jgi:hypothetical protein